MTSDDNGGRRVIALAMMIATFSAAAHAQAPASISGEISATEAKWLWAIAAGLLTAVSAGATFWLNRMHGDLRQIRDLLSTFVTRLEVQATTVQYLREEGHDLRERVKANEARIVSVCRRLDRAGLGSGLKTDDGGDK